MKLDQPRVISTLRFVVFGLLAAVLAGAHAHAQQTPVSNMTVHTIYGTCSGGVRNGLSCLNNYDCSGACLGGSRPGELCTFGDTVFCRGGCSGNNNIRCFYNVECSAQSLGSCTSPPRGTCSNPPAGTCSGASAWLTWDPVPSASGYDGISGSLIFLRQNMGSIVVRDCLASNTPSTTMPIDGGTYPENPTWFLVRAKFGSINGTYDEGGNQVGSRDTHPVDCP